MHEIDRIFTQYPFFGSRQIAAQRQVHPTQVSAWKRQAIAGMSEVFSGKGAVSNSNEKEVKELHAKIGQLAMENDFLSQGLRR